MSSILEKLEEDERNCQVCAYTFLGDEEIYIKNDGNIVVEYIECPRCGTKLILDVDRV